MAFWHGAERLSAPALLARGIMVYIYLLLLAKLMGQRELGRLSLFDFIASVILGAAGAAPLADPELSLTPTFVTLGAIASMEVFAAVVSLKSPTLRGFLEGKAATLVKNGRILERSMRAARFNLDDLLTQLRQHGITSWSEVQDVVLEPNGKVSVLKDTRHQPVTSHQLGLSPPPGGIMMTLVEDGHLLRENLRKSGYTVERLEQELAAHGLRSVQEAVAVMLDGAGRLYVSRR
ncbi:MAG: DUF421 domain-containing protein [Bacillota bacterium]